MSWMGALMASLIIVFGVVLVVFIISLAAMTGSVIFFLLTLVLVSVGLCTPFIYFASN